MKVPEERRSQRKRERESELQDPAVYLGRALVNYTTAFLLWLFFTAVFLPAAEAQSTTNTEPLIALVFLIGIAFEAYLGSVAVLNFVTISKASKPAKFLSIELVILADAVLLIPPLRAVSPALGGAVLLIAIVVAVIVALVHIDVLIQYVLKKLSTQEASSSR
ncbi:MAG: hypothetical protein QXY49_03675 [Thermofilaceae archaeon]